MNERSDGKTDITFELRIVENLRSIKGKKVTVHMYGTIHMYGIVHVTVHNTVHIYGPMTWH